MKSYKHIYIKWIHQKNLRNKELKELFESSRYMYRTACIILPPLPSPRSSPNKRQLESIPGFNQHPNSSEEM